MGKKIKNIGLIGAGYWGKNLIRVFDKLSVLKTVCDIDRKVLKEREKEHPHIKFVSDYSEIFNDNGLKAVLIAAPAAAHYDICKKVLASGKDVFVEKPLALDARHGEELVRLANLKKKILMVGHLLRYHPAVVKMKELAQKGEFGKIQYMWSNRLNFGKLRQEENVLWSFAPHDISVIIDFLGMPKKVTVVGGTYLVKGIPDVVSSFFEFKNGRRAHIFASWLNPFKEQKLALIGSEKMAVFDGVKNELMIYPHQIIKQKDAGTGSIKMEAVKGRGYVEKILKEEPLLLEAKHFLECIEKRKMPVTSGEEALGVLKVLAASQKSLLQNKNIFL